MSALIDLLILIGIAVGFAVWILWTWPLGAGFQPTPAKVVRQMLTMAETKPSDVVYDLGSGTGRILLTASKEFGARSVGIEIDPLRFLWTKLKIRALGLSHLSKVIYGNFYDKNLDEATIVTLFLSEGANEKLKDKLEQLRPGTRIVSYSHRMANWKPVAVSHVSEIYLYTIPGK